VNVWLRTAPPGPDLVRPRASLRAPGYSCCPVTGVRLDDIIGVVAFADVHTPAPGRHDLNDETDTS